MTMRPGVDGRVSDVTVELYDDGVMFTGGARLLMDYVSLVRCRESGPEVVSGQLWLGLDGTIRRTDDAVGGFDELAIPPDHVEIRPPKPLREEKPSWWTRLVRCRYRAGR